VNGDVGLAVDAGGEVLGRAGRDGGVALDDLSDYATEGLNAEGEWRYVEKQKVFGCGRAAGEDLGLDGCAEGDNLVGVEVGVWFFAAGVELEEIIDQLADGWDTLMMARRLTR